MRNISIVKSGIIKILVSRPINRLAVFFLKPFPKLSWRERIPVVNGIGLLPLSPGQTIQMGNAQRCSIARELFWNNGQLSRPADRIALSLAVDLSAGAATFLDVGSYTGVFALAVARGNPAVKVHAYEIVPENFMFLWQNVVRNELVGRVLPHLMGIGGEPGSIRVSPDFGIGVLASSIALNADDAEGAAIPVAALDACFPDLQGGLVMKIDVECFEWPVLQGGKELIARLSPDIICEFLRRAPHIPEVERFLGGLGYSLYRISDEGLVPCERIVPVKLERDWLLTKRPPGELEALGHRIVRNAMNPGN